MIDIPALKNAQAEFFNRGRTRGLDFRLAALKKCEEVIIEKETEILDALAQDLGKPKIEGYLSEVFFLLTEIRLFRKKLKRWAKPQRAGNPFYFFPAKSEIRKEPFGCSLIIAPWNYPFQLSLSPLIASVAAGNCVILKPSEIAPSTSAILAKVIHAAFDPRHVAVAEGDAEISKALLAESFDHIFYTGSENVGKIVAKAAAENLTPTVLELGGKCPVVVDEDCDLDLAAERIVAGKFFNAGQTCIAPDFVVTIAGVHGPLVEKLEEKTRAFFDENPVEDLGKIVNDAHFERVRKLAGDDVIQIGEDNPETRHLAPRIIPEADWDHPSMQEEIFGPVLPVLCMGNSELVLEKLREFPSPLALYLFTRRMDWAEAFSSALPSGTIGINDVIKQSANLNLPFGGVGSSGMGRYRGKFGLDAFTYQRSVSRRYFVKDFFAIHPPYSGKFEFFRKFLR